MWQYVLHPLHLINVATLPCESKKHRKCNVTAGYHQKLHQYQSGSRSSCILYLLIWDVMQQIVYETKIHDIDDLQKRLMQSCFDFYRNVINAGVTIWGHVCLLLVDTLNAYYDLNVHLCDSPNMLRNFQCNLIHVTAILYWTLNAEVVFTCIFGFSTFTRQCSNIN